MGSEGPWWLELVWNRKCGGNYDWSYCELLAVGWFIFIMVFTIIAEIRYLVF